MEEPCLNAKNFLSSRTLLVPGSIGEFINLYEKTSPDIIIRAEKLLNPMFQDYTITYSPETERLRPYTLFYENETDKKVSGTFIFQYKDMHIAYPDRFFLTIEDMKAANKFKIDHGRVYYLFRDADAPDIETFINFKEPGYKNIHDYEASRTENTSWYYTAVKAMETSLPKNIRDRFFNAGQTNAEDRISKEADLFYFRIKNGSPSYEDILESFKLGYVDFDTYRGAKRFGSLSYGEFSEFKKHADIFNSYDAYLKAKNNSIWSQSGVLLFEKLTVIREKSGYSNLVVAMVHYILENYIFEKMSREAFTTKIRNIIGDMLVKYGMHENIELRGYNSLLELSIAELEKKKELFEYSQSTGVITIIR